MKRCPQCEFIYEDDQSLCDMDGVLLVFDSRTLPSLSLATVSAPLPGRTSRRNRMVPAFATLILMLAVGSVYYVSTMRNTAPPPNFAPASVSVEPPAAEAPVVVAEPSSESSPEPSASNEVQPAPESKPKAVAAPPTSTKPVATKSAAAKPEPKKDNSKVESILKKTGKILKKPFKF